MVVVVVEVVVVPWPPGGGLGPAAFCPPSRAHGEITAAETRKADTRRILAEFARIAVMSTPTRAPATNRMKPRGALEALRAASPATPTIAVAATLAPIDLAQSKVGLGLAGTAVAALGSLGGIRAERIVIYPGGVGLDARSRFSSCDLFRLGLSYETSIPLASITTSTRPAFRRGRTRGAPVEARTVPAYAHDLNVFFSFVGKEPLEVT